MGLQKIDLDDLFAVLRQAPHVAQPPKSEMHGAAAGPFECGNGMFACEREQSLQDAHTEGPALRQEALGPRAAVGAEQAAAFAQVVGAALDDDALVTVDMGVGGGEAAPLGPHMRGDGFAAQM